MAVKRSRVAPAVARVLLGVIFFVLGLNGFLRFLPAPPEPERAGAFLGALVGTGYMIQLIKGTEVVAGVLLLANRFVPLALTVLAPVVVNIILFHVFLAPAALPIPLLALALGLFLAYQYRGVFRPVLAARAQVSEDLDARSTTPSEGQQPGAARA
jgi:peptidoglycan biosynthesis protein MviN/MurJ (putative lipid II flippase)